MLIYLSRFVLVVFAASTQIRCSSVKRGATFSVEKNVAYRTVDGNQLTGDMYLPKTGDGLRPAVIVIHGGGWGKRSGDMQSICEDLAEAGFVAFNITYRLAPKNRYPKAVEDVKEAFNWLNENAAKYQINKDKISGWGYSAGAHLLLLATLNSNFKLKALVSGGTPADLTAWPKSPLVLDFLGLKEKDNLPLWREASPINHVTTSSPPVFLYHGEWDTLVEPEQMSKMERALKDEGRPVETFTVEYMGHFAVYLFSDAAVEKGIAFIKKNLF